MMEVVSTCSCLGIVEQPPIPIISYNRPQPLDLVVIIIAIIIIVVTTSQSPILHHHHKSSLLTSSSPSSLLSSPHHHHQYHIHFPITYSPQPHHQEII